MRQRTPEALVSQPRYARSAYAWTRLPVPEDDATRAAIAEGLSQADRGEFVDARKLDNLLGHPWK